MEAVAMILGCCASAAIGTCSKGLGMEGMTEAVEVSQEQAADLRALQAAAIEGADVIEQQKGEAENTASAIDETKAVIGVALGLLVPVLPYLGEIYTDEVQGRIAAAYVPVAEKYGWQTGGGIFERYGAEIMLAATVLPVAVQTRAAHGAWVAQREREQKQAEGKPVAAVESKPAQSIQFGTAVPEGAASENG